MKKEFPDSLENRVFGGFRETRKQRKTKKNKYKQNSVKNSVKNWTKWDNLSKIEQSRAKWKKVE